MEQFHVERNGNKILVNREPETPEERLKFEHIMEDALVYAFLMGNPYVEYPDGTMLNIPKTL